MKHNISHSNVIMSAMASQITGVSDVYSTVWGADQRKHQSSVSLALVRGIPLSPVNSPHKGPVTRKIFPFGDVIMFSQQLFTDVPLLVFNTLHHNSRRFATGHFPHFFDRVICFINSSPPNVAYMRQRIGSALVQIMACRLFGAKPLSKSMPRLC